MTNDERSQEALKAATPLEMISVVESTEFYDASIMTDKEKKKEKKRMKKEKKRKVLMANESSSSSQHQQEEQGHEHRQEKRKAAALEKSVATGEELERKKKTKIVIKFSPPSYSQQQQQQPQQQQSEMAVLTREDETETWRETASLKGLSEPELYFSKTVTTTDAKKDQNRYEISVDNMANKIALQELAIRLNSRPSLSTIVMDKKGREYQVFFKYIPSNGRYRFNGVEFGKFITDNKLTAGQIMRIYGLRDGTGGSYRFAFINTDT